MNASACGFPCSGASVNLPMDQCLAWISFYDEMGGAGWPPRCQSRTDPCSCSFGGREGVGGVQCNDANTSITQLLFGVGGGFPSPDVAGTLPASIGAFTDLRSLGVWGDGGDFRLAGTIPASVSAWSQLTEFWLHGNHFTGALPALAYDKLALCQLLLDPHTNRFTCPFPPGVTTHCTKAVGGLWVPMTETDCVCTGASANLAVDQCLAWIELYDSTGGSGWKVCSGMRTDPCACMGADGTSPVCSPDGTVVYQM